MNHVGGSISSPAAAACFWKRLVEMRQAVSGGSGGKISTNPIACFGARNDKELNLELRHCTVAMVVKSSPHDMQPGVLEFSQAAKWGFAAAAANQRGGRLLTNAARAGAKGARHGTRTGGHTRSLKPRTEATEGSTAASLTSSDLLLYCTVERQPRPGYRLPKAVNPAAAALEQPNCAGEPVPGSSSHGVVLRSSKNTSGRLHACGIKVSAARVERETLQKPASHCSVSKPDRMSGVGLASLQILETWPGSTTRQRLCNCRHSSTPDICTDTASPIKSRWNLPLGIVESPAARTRSGP
ncbi:hypothetical protein MKX08_000219 [Trichoderma sp. CBMAI-0020]|nr:hypothetical protein MKX08_000219 [Trichoderma sp. CBMAI-0020]